MINIKTATLGFILGVAGTFVVQHCTNTQEVTLSKSEYYKLKGAELEIKCSEAFDDEWRHSDLVLLQRDRMSDIIRNAADCGCTHVIEAAKDFGYDWETLTYWTCPLVYDFTIYTDDLGNWVRCY